MNTFQLRGILLFSSAFLNLVFALVLWFKGKTKATFHLGWVALASAITAFASGVIIFFESKLFWGRLSWIGIFIPAAYISFVYHFSGRPKHIKLKPSFWYAGAIIIFFLALTTPYIIRSVPLNYPINNILEHGFLAPAVRVYGNICILIAFYYLLKEYFKSKEFKKLQIKYFILGFGIYSIGGILAGGILPLFFPQTAATTTDVFILISVFWVGLTTHAIFKKELFEIKIILTEILIVLIALILLIQASLAESLGTKIFGFILFAFFCLIGYLLIKTTYQEIKSKKQAEGLTEELKESAESLEEKVKERTSELEKSYQELKEKKEEVEKRKEELERFHELTVGRELQMVNLKKRIKELEEKLESLKYRG